MNDVDLNFRLSSTNFDDENARHPCHSVCLALPLIGHFPKLKPAQMKNTWNESVVRMHATDVVSSPIFWLAVSPAWNASTRALVCCWWLCLLIYIENQAQHFPLFIYTTITTQTKTELYNIDCGGFSGKSVFQTMKRVCFTCVCVCVSGRENECMGFYMTVSMVSLIAVLVAFDGFAHFFPVPIRHTTRYEWDGILHRWKAFVGLNKRNGLYTMGTHLHWNIVSNTIDISHSTLNA